MSSNPTTDDEKGIRPGFVFLMGGTGGGGIFGLGLGLAATAVALTPPGAIVLMVGGAAIFIGSLVTSIVMTVKD